MVPIYSFVVLATLAVATEVSSECWTSIRNDTIACYNSAPITFAFDMNTTAECQDWCGRVEKCQSWIYMELSGRCDLHRTAALTISDNAGFTFGGCDPINTTLPVATPGPSSSIAVTSTGVAMETSYPPRAKRGVGHHRHGRQHGNGHHH
ncbi:hypothetical protein DTO013E5_9597 [Penicillium roqueforti]|uniref:Apple domain-containing protein n=1 Tax=Penicillium roqueforti (strain FM164) TaxID=1365484 RepID=W6QIB4_PENRF|nr:hypothetical protein DTO012A1_9660 [Penicillium roqueforti]CDM36563.1 unnamed protein product [Penicillium roqueforti FM164]KAI2739935.1 hypothetical protein DTO013F2_9245 [Penicillium roqueforti]KAI2768230.1 hypothetical protein DTO012A8_6595 [Penicillium roqueforti]KAI3063792.1 hypothetical protein CBS147339_9587 [Penicillium roqueforti]